MQRLKVLYVCTKKIQTSEKTNSVTFSNSALRQKKGGPSTKDVGGDIVDNDIDTDAELVTNDIKVNGLNKFEKHDNEIVKNEIAVGSVNVVRGSSGNTNNYNQGDVANVFGMIQASWDSVDIANVNVDLDLEGKKNKQEIELQ